MMSLFSSAEPMPRLSVEHPALRRPHRLARARSADQRLHLCALLALAAAGIIAAGFLPH